MGIAVEIAVDTLSGARTAEHAGASRIELCACLSEGGTTPSHGTVRRAAAVLAIPVFVMIRPRAGNFVFDSDDAAAMIADVHLAKAAGASGVVIGALAADNMIDRALTARLVREARPLGVTFHRAIDLTPDPVAALDVLLEIGIDRVLTSGGAQTAQDGIPTIRRMVARAAGRICVMPGSGVRDTNASHIIDQTGAREIHLSARTPLPAVAGNGPSIGPGPMITDGDLARRVVTAVEGL